MNLKVLEEEIRLLAYELYEKSGRIPGRDLDNWLEAERIVFERYGLISSGCSRKGARKGRSKKA